MTDVPADDAPSGNSEIVEQAGPNGGVRLLLLKDETGSIREAQEIGADGQVIERTYFPPSNLDR